MFSYKAMEACEHMEADGRRQACLVSHLPHSNCHSDFHKFCVTTWIFRCSLSNAMSMSKNRKEEVPKVMSLIKVGFSGKAESRGRSFQSDKNQNTGCCLTRHHHHCREESSHTAKRFLLLKIPMISKELLGILANKIEKSSRILSTIHCPLKLKLKRQTQSQWVIYCSLNSRPH